jgi:multidrug efflux pump subunit AcrA (membrane-fusion protein)
LPERRPIVVNFGFPMRVLQALRDALARDDLAVIALDQDGRQVFGLGTLIMIESRIDQATASVPARAIFPNDDKRF